MRNLMCAIMRAFSVREEIVEKFENENFFHTDLPEEWDLWDSMI